VDKTTIKPIVWELYSIIQERAPKYCAKKCIDLLDECQEYVLKNISKDDWHSLQCYEGRNGAQPATFATMVIVNLVLSCLRNIKDVVSYEEHQIYYSETPIFQTLMYDEVKDALTQLDEMDRLILLLFYYDGYSAEEVAGMMNCSMQVLNETLNKKLQYLADYMHTTKKEIITTLETTPKKFAGFQGNTSKQIHKKVENARNRLKTVLEGN